MGAGLRRPGVRIWPLVSSLLTLLWLAGCAAPVDRTRQLLELDPTDRDGAITELTNRFERTPEAWQAYSLGILHGARGELTTMNTWFTRCRQLSHERDEDIAYARRRHWREEARAGDEAAREGAWARAADHFDRALAATPENEETRLRAVTARIMAFGPGREEIRALAAAGRPAPVLRWLETAAAPEMADRRLETRVRLASQAVAGRSEEGDALVALVAGELARLDRDWPAMARHLERARQLADDDPDILIPLERSRQATATALLQGALELWSVEKAALALATLDTAETLVPGRADIYTARTNIRQLEGATEPREVARILSVGDLDTAWLSVWMHRLHHQERWAEASLVAGYLLDHPDRLTPAIRLQALRIRVAGSRRSGDLDRAREDLRAMLAEDRPQPRVALLLGDVLLAQSRYAEARHRYEQARAWGDDSVALTLRLAGVAFSQNDRQAMTRWAEEALAREPDNAAARALLEKAEPGFEEGNP